MAFGKVNYSLFLLLHKLQRAVFGRADLFFSKFQLQTFQRSANDLNFQLQTLQFYYEFFPIF